MVRDRFWSQLPFLGGLQPVFDLSNGGEVLVHLGSVLRVHLARDLAGIPGQGVENAGFIFKALDLALDCFRVALNEHSPEEGGGAVFSGEKHSVPCPREAAVCFVDIDPEVECSEAGGLTELFNCELVERDLVTEPAFRGTARAGEKTVFGTVSSGDIGVGHPAEDAELFAHGIEWFQCRAELIVRAAFRREKTLWQET